MGNGLSIKGVILRPVVLVGTLISCAAIGTCTGKNNKSQIETEPSKIDEQLDIKINKFKLATEEKNAVTSMIGFLEKYTGNNVVDCGSTNRFIEGLKRDYDTIHAEAKNMEEGEKKKALENYPNVSYAAKILIQFGITNIAMQSFNEFFQEMGFDPKTAENPDNSEIINDVTKAELEEFRKSARIVKVKIESTLSPGEKVAFKGGINKIMLEHMLQEKTSLPPGAEIVVKEDKPKEFKLE